MNIWNMLCHCSPGPLVYFSNWCFPASFFLYLKLLQSSYRLCDLFFFLFRFVPLCVIFCVSMCVSQERHLITNRADTVIFSLIAFTHPPLSFMLRLHHLLSGANFYLISFSFFFIFLHNFDEPHLHSSCAYCRTTSEVIVTPHSSSVTGCSHQKQRRLVTATPLLHADPVPVRQRWFASWSTWNFRTTKL